MIVESTDGYFYQNPQVEVPKGVLVVSDDGIILKRKGKIKWTTARKGVGVKLALVEDAGVDSFIYQERLATCTRFVVSLKEPIPKPFAFDAKFTSPPTEYDLKQMGDECLLSWS